MQCSHYENGVCLLQSKIFDSKHHITVSFCTSRCKPNNKEKQTEMLQLYGAYISDIPNDINKITRGDVTLDDKGLKHWNTCNDIRRKALQRQGRKRKDSEEIKTAIGELPSKYQMIANLGKHAITVAAHWKKTGRVFVNENQQAERLKICEPCEHYKLDDSGHPRCKQASCGCHLSGELGKTRFEALPCPIGKHANIDKTYRA